MRHNEHQESISLLPGGGEIGGEMLFVMVKHYLLVFKGTVHFW